MADIAVDPFTWSSTAGNNQPTGSTVIGTGLDDNFRAVQAGVKSSLEPLSGVAGTNTITATNATISAYASGQVFRFIPANTNTGATTLNISSLGAKNVFTAGVACVGGELVANVPVEVMYDGTQFQILGAQTTPKTNWTPVLTFGGASVGITYGVQVGRYQKIGNVVHYTCRITLTSKGSSVGNAQITGLSYTAENISNQIFPGAVWGDAMAAGSTYEALITPNSSVIALYKLAAGTSSSLSDTDFGNTSVISVSGIYFV